MVTVTTATAPTELLKDSQLHTRTHRHWGPTAGLAVGVSCLVIPLAGGVSLGLCRAECCSDPSQKHLGYLPSPFTETLIQQVGMKSYHMASCNSVIRYRDTSGVYWNNLGKMVQLECG